ncbi:MAG: hypothetical protein JAY62_08355 [Candidatus Thiodiazotropha endolucinida]|nr:hypothetical protein [Candidatus Thiodiazotropha taylori]MCW4275120.1 hypothetical protein [Candidatus Thiodiazotropha taylori]
MEVLKELDRITEADERQQHFAVVDNQTGEYRRLTLEDVYRQTESIQLHNPVPDKVKSHFSTAKNLLVYSWYHYPFNVTAQFLAFVTVEMALKDKFKIEKYQSFRSLIKLAVEEGMVKDDGFEHLYYKSETQELLEKEGMIEDVRPYVETLTDVMPKLRNELAHGGNMLHMNGAKSVKICADFINQLYSENTANNGD